MRRTRFEIIGLFACAAIGAVGVAPLSAEEAPGFAPLTLAASTNFNQTETPGLVEAAIALGVDDLRDGMYWKLIEQSEGAYTFDLPTTAYPAALGEAGIGLSVTVNWGNPLYDEGFTPHSAEAIAAHGRYIAALIERFPAIHTIEVGNEFNGDNFVSGPVRGTDIEGRAAAHVAILKSVHAAAKSANRPIKVLGGAAHSIPAGYLWSVLDQGGAEAMDALVIHPYTTRPEDLAKEIAVLRRHPKARALPLEVTEFGWTDPHSADAYLIKMVAVMAISGVERAAWYALNKRGDRHIPLMNDSGEPTAAGRAFAFAEQVLAGRQAEDVSPDPYTHAVRFGETALVLWGEPRDVSVADGVRVYDARGDELSDEGLRLADDAPIILVGRQPIVLGQSVELAPHNVLADSAFDFAYPNGVADPPEGAIERFIRINRADEEAFQTMPGQERAGTIWTPYLSRDTLFPLRLTATSVVARAGPETPRIVQRYRAKRSGPANLVVELSPSARSTDGMVATIWRNNVILASETVTEPFRFAKRLDLRAGDTVELEIGAGPTDLGDVANYRFRLTAVDPHSDRM